MIKSFKKLRDKLFGIDKLEYRITNGVMKYIDFKFKELKALRILEPYMPKGYIFETEYTLSFQEIQHIANDIVIHRPLSILEIGSGLSTVILSNIIADLDYNPEFISVDQDASWQDYLKIHCKNVIFFDFNITSSSNFSDSGGKWFDIPDSSIIMDKRYDLVIIDGPKGYETKYARLGILKFLNHRINQHTIIYLDDTDRVEEKFIAQRLKETFSFVNCRSFGKYSRLSNRDLIITSPS